MPTHQGLLALLLLVVLASCAHEERRIGPAQDCRWVYKESGLPAFLRFDKAPQFNPFIHISRTGLTARVIGVLPDDFVRAAGGIERVVARFPWLTPVSKTTVHEVTADDPSKAPMQRQGRGLITSTNVISLPPNAVMIVYPVARERPASNTLAGNWWLREKQRQRHSIPAGAYGGFPFLRYSENGHALHGPIDSEEDMWSLHRGKVSHGCQRMEGEHILELAVLLGCSREPPTSAADRQGCPQYGYPERVTVMDDYDFIPNRQGSSIQEGLIDYSQPLAALAEALVAVDSTYPRTGMPASPAQVTIQKIQVPSQQQTMGPNLRVRQFPIWDNRVNDLAAPLSNSCRPR